MISNARQKLIQLEEDTRAAELRPAPNREPAPPSGPIQNDLFIGSGTLRGGAAVGDGGTG